MITICLVSSNELEATYITNTCKSNYWYTHEMDPDLEF